MTPAVFLAIFTVDKKVPIPHAMIAGWGIMLLAAANCAAAVMAEEYRRQISRLSIPAILGSVCVILMFLGVAALNRFFEHMGYKFIAPLAIAAFLLVGIAALAERKMTLKLWLGINGLGLTLVWAMVASERVTLPF